MRIVVELLPSGLDLFFEAKLFLSDLDRFPRRGDLGFSRGDLLFYFFDLGGERTDLGAVLFQPLVQNVQI